MIPGRYPKNDSRRQIQNSSWGKNNTNNGSDQINHAEWYIYIFPMSECANVWMVMVKI
jgi:hypothetical protein